MNRKTILGIAAACAMVAATVWAAEIKNQRLSGQRFTAEVRIKADSEDVWSVLTRTGKLTRAFGYVRQGGWNERFERVGDACLMRIDRDAGSLILTYLNPRKELRYTWEPDNGTYLCQQRWTLWERDGRTTLRFEERYTESSPQGQRELDRQARDIDVALGKVKDMAESDWGARQAQGRGPGRGPGR